MDYTKLLDSEVYTSQDLTDAICKTLEGISNPVNPKKTIPVYQTLGEGLADTIFISAHLSEIRDKFLLGKRFRREHRYLFHLNFPIAEVNTEQDLKTKTTEERIVAKELFPEDDIVDRIVKVQYDPDKKSQLSNEQQLLDDLVNKEELERQQEERIKRITLAFGSITQEIMSRLKKVPYNGVTLKPLNRRSTFYDRMTIIYATYFLDLVDVSDKDLKPVVKMGKMQSLTVKEKITF